MTRHTLNRLLQFISIFNTWQNALQNEWKNIYGADEIEVGVRPRENHILNGWLSMRNTYKIYSKPLRTKIIFIF